jgi:hypothetical protein
MTTACILLPHILKAGLRSGSMTLRWRAAASIAVLVAAVLPLTAQQVSNEPLSVPQKFGFAVKNSFAPLVYPEVALIAGFAQATNQQRSFGQGEGYAKRVGLAFADQANAKLMTQAVFPALLKQDPRYYRLGQGSFSKRLGYSVSRVWITRRDDGTRTANISAIGGAAVAAGISRVYYPSEDRTVGKTMGNWGVQIGTTALFCVAQEFWPDIRRKIFHK